MAEKIHKIKVNATHDDLDESFDAAGAHSIPEDEVDSRAPIDLNAPVGLEDALAGVHGMESDSDDEDDRGVIDLDATIPSTPKAEAAAPSGASRDEVEALKAQAATANENYLRALADLQNFRRRGEEERLRIIRDGNEKLLKELLPVLDDFDLAANAAKQSESYEQLANGVDAILRKFRETLQKQGVEAIAAVGEKFDPDLHEAVMLDEDSEQEDETVTAELRKGYTMNGRVIRPTLVKVAKNS
ncbi:protein GrpE [Capsulimonas corticalis]|uniref:Protein GrpE n=1 Tax=Capsulimonas corticalis TaxID=2219043 RepID=A0A402CQE5_9BACT|nr:nucleotide exchange factor GrpE [Capsulimonas corticalis]BDI32689.1 protein GrpE [Capsulimonas corticalis]